MEVKTIKGMDEETWIKFKMLAVKRRVTMGKLLANMIETYERNTNEFWNEILSGKRIISDKEAEELEDSVKKLRKERGFKREFNF
jgi:hypothetical protein